MTLEDQPPVPGGTTAIRGGKYVTEERAPGPPNPFHGFQPGGGCMSRCRCGKTFSDPVHGPEPENIRRIREAL